MDLVAIIWWLICAACVTSVVNWVTGLSKQGAEGSKTGAGSSRDSPPGSSHRTGNQEDSSKHQNDGRRSSNGCEEEEDSYQDDSFGSFRGVRLRPQSVPGATGEIARILSAKDHFEVLEISREADVIEIKKAFRNKQMATHPDKAQGAAGSKEASQRVNEANHTLSDEVRRRQYLIQLKDEEQRSSQGGRATATGKKDMEDLFDAFEEFVKATMGPPPKDALYPTANPAEYNPVSDEPDHRFRMACECGYDHMCTKVQGRSSSRARLCNCSRCGYGGGYLSARDNDVWFEMTFSFRGLFSPETGIKAYRCIGPYVYDITAWARCNGMLQDDFGKTPPCNVHYVPFRLSSETRKDRKRSSSGYGNNPSGPAPGEGKSKSKKGKGRRGKKW